MELDYVLFPILVNAGILVAVAMVFNHLLRAKQEAHIAEVESHLHLPEKYLIRHSDLVYALSEIQSYIDVSEEDLLRVYNLATEHAHPGEMVKDINDAWHAKGVWAIRFFLKFKEKNARRVIAAGRNPLIKEEEETTLSSWERAEDQRYKNFLILLLTCQLFFRLMRMHAGKIALSI